MAKKHKATYDEVIGKKKFANYQEEFDYIKKLIDEGSISPIKASGTNGKKPAMFRAFWISDKEIDYSEYIDELKYKLSTDINPEFYLQHPEIYAKEREYVIALSKYLEKSANELKITVSENERSYAIWKKEKFLSGHGQRDTVSAVSVLRHCGISVDKLNVYHTTEPLVYFSIDKVRPQNILVLENLDPFYGMRKRLMSGRNDILGKKFSTLIYGGGKRVNAFFTGFNVFAEDYLKDSSNVFYYYGDLDYEGIGIFESFTDRFKDSLNIVPFIEAYTELISNIKIDELPNSKQLQNRNIDTYFFSFFDGVIAEKMKNILESGKYVPQEKLSIIDY